MTAGAAKAGVVGWPVAHSLSPVMMEAWLADTGLAGSYERIAASPDTFVDTIVRLRGAGFSGVNITLPHKESALALADRASEAARACGAANVLVFGEAGFHADNTDIVGIRAALEAGGWQPGEGPAVLVGAGGAARAALFVLKASGVPVRIVNRSTEKAADLARSMGCAAEIYPFQQAASALEHARLVINATSLGMTGEPPLALPLHGVSANAVVFDMVYAPLETPLLRAARTAGLSTADGLSMLIGQARPAFELFFGTPPPDHTPVRALLESALEARS